QLFEAVLALGPRGRLAHLLHRGHQQANKDGNNGDHYQQFDQRECAPWVGHTRPPNTSSRKQRKWMIGLCDSVRLASRPWQEEFAGARVAAPTAEKTKGKPEKNALRWTNSGPSKRVPCGAADSRGRHYS